MAWRGLNKQLIIGHLGGDPEVGVVPGNDTMISRFTVAVSEHWKDRQSGEQKQHTEWFKCIAFNQTAEFMRSYVRKGSKVYVEGATKTRGWIDNQGQKQYITELVVTDLQLLDSPSQNNSDGDHDDIPV